MKEDRSEELVRRSNYSNNFAMVAASPSIVFLAVYMSLLKVCMRGSIPSLDFPLVRFSAVVARRAFFFSVYTAGSLCTVSMGFSYK